MDIKSQLTASMEIICDAYRITNARIHVTLDIEIDGSGR